MAFKWRCSESYHGIGWLCTAPVLELSYWQNQLIFFPFPLSFFLSFIRSFFFFFFFFCIHRFQLQQTERAMDIGAVHSTGAFSFQKRAGMRRKRHKVDLRRSEILRVTVIALWPEAISAVRTSRLCLPPVTGAHSSCD